MGRERIYIYMGDDVYLHDLDDGCEFGLYRRLPMISGGREGKRGSIWRGDECEYRYELDAMQASRVCPYIVNNGQVFNSSRSIL